MRQYDDVVEVRREGARPDQFLWRGHLWKVRSVAVRWVETSAWWRSTPVRAVLGTGDPGRSREGGASATDLLEERVVWRVEAGRPGGGAGSVGVFDLAHEVEPDRWRLVGCAD